VSERVRFQLSVRPDRVDEYKARHRDGWPEMLEALRATGWRNYSPYLRGDGLRIGCLECEDCAAAHEGMEETGVNARWQAQMAPFFELPDGSRPDTAFTRARGDLAHGLR
jgi:L-rhamnose mutarotase